LRPERSRSPSLDARPRPGLTPPAGSSEEFYDLEDQAARPRPAGTSTICYQEPYSTSGVVQRTSAAAAASSSADHDLESVSYQGPYSTTGGVVQRGSSSCEVFTTVPHDWNNSEGGVDTMDSRLDEDYNTINSLGSTGSGDFAGFATSDFATWQESDAELDGETAAPYLTGTEGMETPDGAATPWYHLEADYGAAGAGTPLDSASNDGRATPDSDYQREQGGQYVEEGSPGGGGDDQIAGRDGGDVLATAAPTDVPWQEQVSNFAARLFRV